MRKLGVMVGIFLIGMGLTGCSVYQTAILAIASRPKCSSAKRTLIWSALPQARLRLSIFWV